MKCDQDEGEQLELSTFSCFCDNVFPTSNSLPECGAPGLDRMRFSRLNSDVGIICFCVLHISHPIPARSAIY